MNECEKTSERMASERKQKQGETPKQRDKRQEIKLCQREQPIVEKKDQNLPVHTERKIIAGLRHPRWPTCTKLACRNTKVSEMIPGRLE